MREHRRRVGQSSRVLVCLYLIAQAGCRFDSSGLPVSCSRYQCKIGIYKCATYNQMLKINLNGTDTCYKPQPQPPEKITDPNFGLQVGDEPYCLVPWAIKVIELDDVKGSVWIKAPYDWNAKTDAVGVQFQVLHDVEALYIGYDNRIVKEPNWLTTNYVQEADVLQVPADEKTITVMMPNKLTATSEVRLNIWRRKTAPKAGDIVTIPGNLHGNPQLAVGLEPKYTAMYLVMIKPKPVYDCSKTQFIPANREKEAEYDNCGKPACEEDANAVKAGALAKAKELLKQFPPNTHVLGEPELDDNYECPDRQIFNQKYGLQLEPRAFLRHSEIEFDPNTHTSEARIKIARADYDGKHGVTGRLNFEYVLDAMGVMQQLKLNSMILHVEDVDTDAGDFRNIVVAMCVPAVADCNDAIPPIQTPCDNYVIGAGKFITSARADTDDGVLFVLGQNRTAMQVNIDQTARTFQVVGGPVIAQMKINDEDADVEISIDVTGHFANFAPVADAAESTMWVQCGMRRDYGSGNKDPIHLDASTSFEIYGDPMPTDPASYRWFEDYALVTEKFWGMGKQVTIPQEQLSFGVHKFTLIVRDDHGITDSTEFDVTVADTIPPYFAIPQDVIILLFPPNVGPIKVNLGQAWAWDTCASFVFVSNDAPPNMMFPTGLTQVTWTADDGRGNVVTKVQEVTIIPQEVSIVQMVRTGVIRLESAIEKTKARIAEWVNEPNCVIDLASLVGVAEALTTALGNETPPEGQQDDYAAIEERLTAARVALTEADNRMRSAEASDNAEVKAELRLAASDYLTTASDIMGEIREMPEPQDSSGDGLFPQNCGDCFIATAVYGSYMAPEVMVLRRFRDRHLLTNAPGRWIVAAYYRTSPPIAAAIARHDTLRWGVRCLLAPIVYGTKYPGFAGAVVLLLFLCLWQRKRRVAHLRNGLGAGARSRHER